MHDGEADKFGPLVDTVRSAIHARGLLLDLAPPIEAIEQKLLHNKARLAARQRAAHASGYVKIRTLVILRPGSPLEIDLGQPQALRLAQLELDGLAIRDSLTDLGIGFERELNRFVKRHSACRAHRNGKGGRDNR